MMVGGPTGVPTGNPSIGSAGNTAATIMLNPKAPRNPLAARDRGPSTRLNPTAAATTIKPLSTKFAVWIHPPGPLASTLSGCRVKSKPLADKRLDQADREIERTRQHAVAKQGSRDGRAAIECRVHALPFVILACTV